MTPPQQRRNFAESLGWLSRGRSIWEEQPHRKIDSRLREKWHIRDNDASDIIRAKAEEQLERLILQYPSNEVERNAIRVSFNIGGLVSTDLDLGERQKQYYGDTGFSQNRSRNVMKKAIPAFALDLQAATPGPLPSSEIEPILRRYREYREGQIRHQTTESGKKDSARVRSRKIAHTVRARSAALARSARRPSIEPPASPTAQASSNAAPGQTQSDVTEQSNAARVSQRSHEFLTPVVNQLASTVWAELRATTVQVGSPTPIVVYWQHVPDVRDGLSENSMPLNLDGHSGEIRTTFDQIPSGRLVILGRAGAGKTILAQQLAQSLVDPSVRESGTAVPVIFPLSSWNPHRQRLRAWLAASLVKNGYVRKGRRRSSSLKLASELINSGLILPILDGFDEIPEEVRLATLELIDELGPLDQFVLTSRPEEYIAAAARPNMLASATVVQLKDLSREDVTRYLAAEDSLSVKWKPVLGALTGGNQDGKAKNPVCEALSTPLMVSLAKTGYSEPDALPAELLDESMYPNAGAIQDRLFDKYLASNYSPFRQEQLETSRKVSRSWELEDAQRWLGFIALHLHAIGEQDFRWSGLRRAAPNMVMWPNALLAAIWLQVIVVDKATRAGASRSATFVAVVIAVYALARYLFVAERRSVQPRNLRIRLWGHIRSILKEYINCALSSVSFTLLSVLAIDGLISLAHLRWMGMSSRWENATITILLFGSFTLLFGDSLEKEFTEPPSIDRDFGFRASLRNGRKNSLIRVTFYVPLLVLSVLAALIFLKPGALFIAGVPLLFLLLLGNWGVWLQARAGLTIRGALPRQLLGFLDDAHHRGILRTTSSGYQFRHALLQDYLAVRAYSGEFGVARYPRNYFDLRYSVALSLLRQSKLSDAERELQSLLETLCMSHSECRLRSFSVRSLLALILTQKEQYAEAEVAFCELAADEVKYLGSDDQWTLATLDMLTTCIEAREPEEDDVVEYGELLTVVMAELSIEPRLVERLRVAVTRYEQVAGPQELADTSDAL